MATDFAVAYFALPVLIGIAVLFLVAVSANRSPDNGGFLELGAKRISFGYLGALAVLLVYAAVDSVIVGYWQIDRGYLSADKMPQVIPGWTLYQFILLAPFVVLALTLIGLPFLYLFKRIKLASVLGAGIVAIAYSAVDAWMTYRSPYNRWCHSHLDECTIEALERALWLAMPVAVGFAISARLPWLRSKSSAT